MNQTSVWNVPQKFLPRLALGLSALFAALSPDVARSAELTVFATPSVSVDGLWMADAKGLFVKEGLDVKIRLFPSGTTAFQTFKTGAGDVIFSGDLPGLQYWQNGGSYQVIAPIERDFGGYIGVTKKEIKTAKDLVGKTIATRIGSTGSWFVSEYLTKNDIDEKKVTVRNLDPPLMPVALCQGDIDGFFVWLPSPMKALQICGDKVHYLTTAENYIKGYNIAGARTEYLADPKNADTVKRFLRAVINGAEIGATNESETRAELRKRFGYTDDEITTFRGIMERVFKFDATFFADFCSENKWQQRAGLRGGPSDLADWVWMDGLKSLDPKLVSPPPPAC